MRTASYARVSSRLASEGEGFPWVFGNTQTPPRVTAGPAWGRRPTGGPGSSAGGRGGRVNALKFQGTILASEGTFAACRTTWF